MAIRPLNTELQTSLLNEEEFAYAHIVKFEKGLLTSTGESAKGPNTYSYVTDGSFDIVFDDGSLDSEGNSNGPQTYIANKLLSVGSITEKTHASASSFNLNIAANALNTTLSTNIVTTSSTITAPVDLVDAGFSEGDKIQLVFGNSSETNHNDYFRIDSFTNENKTAVVTASSTALVANGSSRGVTLRFASEEVVGPLKDKGAVGYATYLNRDIFVYKAHIDVETGSIIGAPFLLFKGIIASSKLSDDPDKGIQVSWGCTSHWGDFVRVNGRLTTDSDHRALTGSGASDPSALKRIEYQNDLGFLHSEQAINLMAIYQVQETRQKVKFKKGFLGFGSKVKTQEYTVDVDREVDLRFNLEAKYLPVVYGVQRIDSIPIFVDSLKTDSKKVYAAYALCEGPIASLLDVYFDDVSSICIDGKDFDTRSSQTEENTVDVLCTGRADRGDTLTGVTVNGTTQVNFGFASMSFGGSTWNIGSGFNFNIDYSNTEFEGFNINPTFATGATSGATAGVGTVHEKGNTFVTPIDTRLVFHAGKDNQKADNLLANIALQNNFKVQSDYYTGTADYWGPNHQLLDTAYVVAEYTIGEGETTIPALDFTVRGKILECYNYDYSYTPDVTRVSDPISNFGLGDAVEIRRSSNAAKLDDAVIADIYTFVDEEGFSETRVRFKDAPDLSYGSEGQDIETAFYINPVGNTAIKWHMTTYSHVFDFGEVEAQLVEEIVSAGTGSSSGSSATIPSSSNVAVAANLPFTSSIALATAPGFNLNFEFTEQELRDIAAMVTGTFNYDAIYGATNTVIDNLGAADDLDANEVNVIIIKDAIKLSNTASNLNDAYNDLIIEVSRTNTATGDVYTQQRKIIDYDGASKIATVGKPFDYDYIPASTDTFRILPTGDRRVSINPAIQLLDYTTNTRYGRGLNISRDLNLSTFLDSARTCDTRSDVTVQISSSTTIAEGEEYRYPATGDVQFQGTVKSFETLNGYKQVVFTDVIGKLGYRWQDWKSFPVGELVWHPTYATNGSFTGTFLVAGTGSTMPAPTVNQINSVTLRKVGTTTDIDLNLDWPSAADGNVLVRAYSGLLGQQYTSGYSLYDSDDVKYWRYVGWDSQDQRQVTRHQTNMVLNTSASLFDNINNMLGHFNGILRHSNGAYELSVASGSSTFEAPQLIHEDDIIGQLNVEDAGQKGTYNTVTTSVSDPQIMFGERSVTFFNSNYLKEDKNIPKKGDIKTPFITNYFNSRINAKQFLEQSRYGLSINFTLGPRGALLLAGELIKITHPRFGWDEKMFRISSLTLKDNCLVQVSADEHTDSAYLISHVSEPSIKGAEATTANIAPPLPITGLEASSNDRGGIELNWVNSAGYNPATYSIQIWRNDDISFSGGAGAKLVATVKGDTYTDTIISEGRLNKYYWVRYTVNAPQQRSSQVAPKEIFSVYHPLAVANGILGISDSNVDGVSINFTNENTSVSTLENDELDFSDTNVDINVFIGSNIVPFDGTSPYATPSFRVTSVADEGITTPVATNTSTTWSQGNISEMTIDKGKITYTITIKNTLGDESNYSRVQNIAKLFRGSDGSIGTDGDRGPGVWHIGVTTLPNTSAQAATAWDNGSGSQPATEIASDQAWFYTGTQSDPTTQAVFIFDGIDWIEQAQVIDGDLIVSGTITADAIAANTITAEEIAAGTITADQIAAATITATEIAADAITAEKIEAGAITSEKIDSEAITTDKLAANSITAAKIDTNAITADKVAADAITAAKINVTDLSSIAANIGAITAGTLSSNVTDPIPDANSAPTDLENGAFIDLNAGKFVFGDASEYILWNGTNLTISGGTITGSTFDGTAGVIVQEDGTEEAATATTLNFTSGINVEVTDNVATISVDAPDDFVNSLSFATATGILTVGRSESTDLTVDLDGRYLTTESNDYADSLAFATDTGILTIGRTGSLTDLTVDLDGRYLTTYTDTNNFPTSLAWSTTSGVLTLNRNGLTALTVDLDGRYSTTDTTYTIGSSTSGDDVRINLTGSDTTTDFITLTAGANVSLSQTGDVITIAAADSDSVLSNEDVEDIVGAMVSGNTETGITVTYDDPTGKLNFSATGTTYAISAVDSAEDAIIRLAGGGVNDDVTLAAGNNISIDVSGDTITINAGDTDTVLTSEEVQDIVGAMFTGNTETNISATYQDGDGTIDLVSSNDYADSLAFATDTGILTVGRTGSLTDLTVDLDGRYLTSQTTNLSYTTAATTGTVNSSTGTNATLPAATTSLAGLLTGEDKTKLNGIATNANNYSLPTNNVTNATVSGQTLTLTRQGAANTTFTNTDTNNYPTSFGWATNTGVLTLNRSGLSAISIDLDGRYSTSDTNTTYTIGAVDSGANAILRLTAGGSGSGTDDVTFIAGSNITLTPNTTNSTIEIDATDTNTTNFNVQANSGTATNISAGETINFIGSGATSIARSGNVFTISSTDNNTDTTNFNIRANTSATTNISAGETISFTGSGATSVTRSGNTFTIASTDTNTNTTYSAGAGLSLSGTQFSVTNNSTTFENIKAAYAQIDTIVAQNIDTNVLNANSVLARTVQVFPSGGTAPNISGTTLTGSGAILKSDGDFYIGNVSANKYMFWDQSAGSMTVRGTINADDIQGDVSIVRGFQFPAQTVSASAAWTQIGGEIELDASTGPGGHIPQAIISGYIAHTSNIDHRLRILMKTDAASENVSIGVPLSFVPPGKYLGNLQFVGDKTVQCPVGSEIQQDVTGAKMQVSFSYYTASTNRTSVSGYGQGTFNLVNNCYAGFTAGVYTQVGSTILGRTGNSTSEKNFSIQGYFGKNTTGTVTMKLEMQNESTSGAATITGTTGMLIGIR